MKKISFTIIISIVFLLNITLLNAAEPQTKEGTKAIFYGFNGLSDLSVDNSYFGAQYLFADKMGVWVNLGLSFLSDKPDKNAEERTTNNTEFSVGFLHYIFQKGPIACYYSPQIGFGFGSDEDKSRTLVDKIDNNMLYIGCTIGCEWWFTDNLSLIASTFFGYKSDKTTIKYVTGAEDEATQTTIGIIPSVGACFLIGFHF